MQSEWHPDWKMYWIVPAALLFGRLIIGQGHAGTPATKQSVLLASSFCWTFGRLLKKGWIILLNLWRLSMNIRNSTMLTRGRCCIHLVRMYIQSSNPTGRYIVVDREWIAKWNTGFRINTSYFVSCFREYGLTTGNTQKPTILMVHFMAPLIRVQKRDEEILKDGKWNKPY